MQVNQAEQLVHLGIHEAGQSTNGSAQEIDESRWVKGRGHKENLA